MQVSDTYTNEQVDEMYEWISDLAYEQGHVNVPDSMSREEIIDEFMATFGEQDLPRMRSYPKLGPALVMGPTIQTAGGQYFDFLRPEESEFTIEDIAHALANICRFTGHTRVHYSVAQHSVLVSQLVPQAFAMQALLHDAAEAFLGDVSSPLKQLLPDYKAIEARVERAVMRRFELPDELDPSIKVADLIALATEKRDLMPQLAGCPGWEVLRGVEPAPNRIIPHTPVEAKAAFLARFDDLWNLGLGQESDVRWRQQA